MDFIISERNALLKEGITMLIIEDGDENRSPTSPTCSVIWRGERTTAQQLLSSCLKWRDSELDMIEKSATEHKVSIGSELLTRIGAEDLTAL